MSVSDLIAISQWTGWAPIAGVLILAIAVGFFFYREKDVIYTARIDYIQKKLDDCEKETPTVLVHRRTEQVHLMEAELADISARQKADAERFEQEKQRLLAELDVAQQSGAASAQSADLQAEKANFALGRLRQEYEAHLEELDQRHLNLEREKAEALFQVARLSEELAKASKSLDAVWPRSGGYDKKIAESILWYGRFDQMIYVPVRIGWRSDTGERLEQREKIFNRLQGMDGTQSLVLSIARDGQTKMGCAFYFDPSSQDYAGSPEQPNYGDYYNDYIKTLVAILNFANVTWLPERRDSMVRAVIEIRGVQYVGPSPIDPLVVIMSIRLQSDTDRIREAAPLLPDTIK